MVATYAWSSVGPIQAVYNSNDEEIFGIVYCYYASRCRLIYNRVAIASR